MTHTKDDLGVSTVPLVHVVTCVLTNLYTIAAEGDFDSAFAEVAIRDRHLGYLADAGLIDGHYILGADEIAAACHPPIRLTFGIDDRIEVVTVDIVNGHSRSGSHVEIIEGKPGHKGLFANRLARIGLCVCPARCCGGVAVDM